MMQKFAALLIALVVMSAALFLLQLWFDIFSTEFFWKLGVTLLVVAAAAGAVVLIKKDFAHSDTLKKDKFIN